MAKRLVKIAKELNVGTTTIVEYLNNNGFDIENKPTAKVSDAMYDELLKEFRKSIAIKEQADQLVIGTRPTNKKEKATESTQKDIPSVKDKKTDAEADPTPSSTPSPVIEEKKNQPKIIKASDSLPKLKVLGKIDLESNKKKQAPIVEGKTIEQKVEIKKQEQEQSKTVLSPPAEKKESLAVESTSATVEKKVDSSSIPPKETEQIKKEPAPVVPKKEETKPQQVPEVVPPIQEKVQEQPKLVTPKEVVKKIAVEQTPSIPKEKVTPSVPLPSTQKEKKEAPKVTQQKPIVVEQKEEKIKQPLTTSQEEKKEVIQKTPTTPPVPEIQKQEPIKAHSISDKKEPSLKSSDLTEGTDSHKATQQNISKQEKQKVLVEPIVKKTPEVKKETSEKTSDKQISKKEQQPLNKKELENKVVEEHTANNGDSEVEGSQEVEGTQKKSIIRANAPELRGLKILGKIDTDQFKRKKKKKDKSTKTSSDSTKPGESGERKKRKRTRRKVSSDSNSSNNNSSNNRSSSDNRNSNDSSNSRNRSNSNNTNDRSSNSRNSNSDTNNRRDSGSSRSNSSSRSRSSSNSSSSRSSSNSSSSRSSSNSNRSRRDRNSSRNSNYRRGNQVENREVSKKEIEEKIKATMARMERGSKKKRQRLRRENRERLKEKQEMREMEAETTNLQITEFISVSELASLMDVSPSDVIMTCMNLGVIVSINQRLDAEIIELVAEEYGHEVEFISAEEAVDEEVEIEDAPEDLQNRAPIVTVMGHVDHGKTSLLDYIRNANVADGEAGGITQHIGAYEVKVGEENKKITFLDTPGHEAFTAMRARGAKVTDIAIIIIAADDNIMPQTKEAISHAQAAGVPMIFAINKIDKEGAQPERIKQELASMNILVEDWGGEYLSQDISAKTGLNIDELLEKVLLQAELLELQANPDRDAIGAILEASLDKGRGYVAKMLVQTGTLAIGDAVVSGEHSGKVKAMFNERGKRLKKAGPSQPVLVLGLSGAPQAGERFKVLESEQEARQIASRRAQIVREQANRATKRISLDEIGRRLALGNFKELNLIIKGDFDGSIEALSDSLIKLSVETIQVNIIHKAVGQIIESDVLLASASDAIIIGFQVRPSVAARKLAEREGVEIKLYSIIYEAIEEVKAAMEGMLEPTKKEEIVGNAEVREVYKISKVGTVAGCYVSDGKINRNNNIRIIRDGIVIYPTKENAVAELDSLKRFKDDTREVKNGLECGLTVKNFNDIKVGDVIEAYEIVEVKQTLE